jgi:hypothetical protein
MHRLDMFAKCFPPSISHYNAITTLHQIEACIWYHGIMIILCKLMKRHLFTTYTHVITRWQERSIQLFQRCTVQQITPVLDMSGTRSTYGRGRISHSILATLSQLTRIGDPNISKDNENERRTFTGHCLLSLIEYCCSRCRSFALFTAYCSSNSNER